MSGEHFSTFLIADARTDPKNPSRAQWAAAGSGVPRWPQSHAWMTVYMFAHDVIDIAATTVANESMCGISGDMPQRRAQAAAALSACARMVRALALDAACDGECTDKRWSELVDDLKSSLEAP